MDGIKDEKNMLRGAFPRSLHDHKVTGSQQAKGSENRVVGQYYAIVSEQGTIKRFQLIQRSGCIHSIPYSLLPVYILSDNQELLIKAYGMHISIHGRCLEIILRHLSDECLLWLKESKSGKDDGTSNVFISEIEIEGDAVSTTPTEH